MMPLWLRPRTLDEALELLARWPGVRPLAGATDVMVERRLKGEGEAAYLDLHLLGSLRGIRETANGIWIGALTTFAEIARSDLVRAHYPLLVASAQVTGAVAIQNRATIGGNIMNASPAADNPPVLLAYGAAVSMTSLRGERILPYEILHTGYKATLRAPDELLTGIFLPRVAARARQYFRKVGARSAQAISKVTVAAVIEQRGELFGTSRFGFASVGPTPMLARDLAACLAGKPAVIPPDDTLSYALSRDLAPRDDIRSSAAYRRQVAFNLVREALAPWKI